MRQSLKYTIKPFLLSSTKQLTIEPSYIEFDGKIKFLKNEVAAIRCGIKGIRGYSFNIGRIYCIDIKNTQGQIMKIRFRSFYGIRREILDDMYRKIIQAVHNNFLHDISNAYFNKFVQKEEFEILGVNFTQDGLILDKKWEMLPWLDVSTKNYSTYYAIFSMTEPTKNKTFKYIADWNTSVLYSASRGILKSKGLWKE